MTGAITPEAPRLTLRADETPRVTLSFPDDDKGLYYHLHCPCEFSLLITDLSTVSFYLGLQINNFYVYVNSKTLLSFHCISSALEADRSIFSPRAPACAIARFYRGCKCAMCANPLHIALIAAALSNMAAAPDTGGISRARDCRPARTGVVTAT